MTIDERLEFLVQSTESLHATVSELHATVAKHDAHIGALLEVAVGNENRWLRVLRVLRDALDAGLGDDGEEGGGE